MFLNHLSFEQKNIFLDLCIHAANANNDFADEEKRYIDQYCVEMQLSKPRYETDSDLNTALSQLVKISTKIELKIITLELLGLLFSDKQYDKFEKKFMDGFISKIELSKDEFQKIYDVFNKLCKLYEEINEIIFK